MKKIAMRATKKDWDSIKDRFNKKTINSITSFDEYDYLINFDEAGKNKRISNIENSNVFEYLWDKNPIIHETFNAKIFLEACGIEFDEYKITKEQILQLYSGTLLSVGTDLNEWFPEVINEQEAFFNKPILSLNDLLSVWGFQSEIELYKTAPLFKNFENLAKSKV